MDAVVFPYFLVKAGFVSFWGLTLISDVNFATIPKYSLVFAALLFAFAAISIGVAVYERLMIGAVTLVITLLALSLLHKSADFGLFKASLYLQPFMAALTCRIHNPCSKNTLLLRVQFCAQLYRKARSVYRPVRH